MSKSGGLFEDTHTQHNSGYTWLILNKTDRIYVEKGRKSSPYYLERCYAQTLTAAYLWKREVQEDAKWAPAKHFKTAVTKISNQKCSLNILK